MVFWNMPRAKFYRKKKKIFTNKMALFDFVSYYFFFVFVWGYSNLF